MEKLLPFLFIISLIAPICLLTAQVSQSDFYSQMGIAGDVASCDAIGGKATASIDDPTKLNAAGLTDAKVGDKLDITRISKDQVLVKNIRTGSTIKLGYGYEEGIGSGYLGKDAPTKPGVE